MTYGVSAVPSPAEKARTVMGELAAEGSEPAVVQRHRRVAAHQSKIGKEALPSVV